MNHISLNEKGRDFDCVEWVWAIHMDHELYWACVFVSGLFVCNANQATYDWGEPERAPH